MRGDHCAALAQKDKCIEELIQELSAREQLIELLATEKQNLLQRLEEPREMEVQDRCIGYRWPLGYWAQLEPCSFFLSLIAKLFLTNPLALPVSKLSLWVFGAGGGGALTGMVLGAVENPIDG
ncbi:proto-oncogene tyrosine-protein kinase Src [Platysternon megacephalum]|uniref:Proto-oncogene tyrosine-protein kinase Src n=1 Tax=Platysternon megacephalum TaxID=55544 RepID=A0A4D9EGN8_9SAUR|nr:proto-oncogene tyrosine-protein kinase Src [Platysternon megacephalum]